MELFFFLFPFHNNIILALCQVWKGNHWGLNQELQVDRLLTSQFLPEKFGKHDDDAEVDDDDKESERIGKENVWSHKDICAKSAKCNIKA